jgi:hypothetical protein
MTPKQIDEATSLLTTFSPQSQQQPRPAASSSFSLIENH